MVVAIVTIFVLAQFQFPLSVISGQLIAERMGAAKAAAGLIPIPATPDPAPIADNIPDGVDYFCLLWDQQSVDIDDWWTKHPEYVADEQNATHQCFHKERSPEKRRLFRRFYENQFRPVCDNPLKRPLRSAGWGSDFSALGEGLLESLSLQKPMLVVPAPWMPKGRGWMYAVKEDGSAATCASKDFACYFLPIVSSACMKGQSFLDLNTTGYDNAGYGIYHRNSSFAWAYQFLARGQSWLRREVVDFVDKQKPRFPPNETCTVMHVRRGDLILSPKSPGARAYHAISEYLDLLPEERRQPGSNFLLLTDDANAIDEASLLHPDLNWHWFNRSRNKGFQTEFGKHNVAATPKDDVVVILGTFEVMKRCDAIVTGRSGFAGLLSDQIVEAWREAGHEVFRALVKENFTDDEERRRSWQLIAERLEAAKAAAGLIPSPATPDPAPIADNIPDGVDYFCLLWDQQSVDIDDWWTKHPEYVADEQNATHQCFHKERSPEKRRLFRRFYENQFRPVCDNPLKRPLRSAGWGSDFSALGEGLLESLSLQKPMLVVPAPWMPKGRGWMYAVKEDGSAATCASKDFACYFLPIVSSACMKGQSFLDLNTTGYDNAGYGIYHRNSSFAWAYQFLARGQSWLRREVVDFVDKQKPRFPPNETCTVMHVRRGDLILSPKSPGARAYHAISEYLDLLPEERRQPGSNFLLLTDDANAIDEASLLHPDLNWHWFNRSRNKGFQTEFGKHNVAATPKDDVVVILGTFEVMKRCDAIVTGRSGFAGLLSDQIVEAWREAGHEVFRALVKENFTDDEERRRSWQLIAERLEAAKAAAGRPPL